jgi:hypothetical protein
LKGIEDADVKAQRFRDLAERFVDGRVVNKIV